MGEIFLARQSGVAGFDRLAILKTLLPDLADDQGYVEQFLDEARVAATLNHPNIVSIYEVGQWNDMYIIAMEYIRGENLARLMHALERAKTRLPRPFAARIAEAAARALDHAHHACDTEGAPLGIVHRDIGLQNIMVRDDGVTKVVDFGIAQAANRSSRTRTGLIKGKLHYMSPEQVLGQSLDGRSDQFSLGIVLWEMVTNKRLLKINDDIEVIRKLTQETLPPPSSVDPTVPAELDAIVMRMLAKNRDERFPRALEAAKALERYIESSGESASEHDLSEFIAYHFGKELAERTRDLTPSQESFASSISSQRFRESANQQTTTIGEVETDKAKAKTIWPWAALALLVVIASSWLLLAPESPLRALSSDTATPLPTQEIPISPPAAALAPTLHLTTTPAGATVRKGELVLGTTPITIDTLDPEIAHSLELGKVGFQATTISLKLERGETRHLAVTLTQAPRAKAQTSKAQPPPRPTPDESARGNGFLTLNTKPWAKVSIDGKPYGATPLYKIELAAGSHIIKLENEAAEIDTERKIVIQPGRTQKLNINLKP